MYYPLLLVLILYSLFLFYFIKKYEIVYQLTSQLQGNNEASSIKNYVSIHPVVGLLNNSQIEIRVRPISKELSYIQKWFS
jgi:hypothetical protein